MNDHVQEKFIRLQSVFELLYLDNGRLLHIFEYFELLKLFLYIRWMIIFQGQRLHSLNAILRHLLFIPNPAELTTRLLNLIRNHLLGHDHLFTVSVPLRFNFFIIIDWTLLPLSIHASFLNTILV